jgi:nucleoside-diphosphate-sugar epimerase
MLSIIKKDAEKAASALDYSTLNNKSVLVTGASGLIGLHIISLLEELKLNYNIKVYAWVSSEVDPKIKPLFGSSEIIVDDLTDKNVIEKSINPESIDIIIHAAGYAQPQKFTGKKINTIKLNTESTTNLFSLLKKNGTFVFCSTSELYSGLSLNNIQEVDIGATTPNHPRACYIESKRCGEAICHAFAEKGFNIKIARISLAYGPGTRINDTRVMHSIIEKGLEQGEIKLLDSGMSIRTYGYVMDLVEMIWNITLHGKNTVYNVCGDSRISIGELATKISEKLNCNLFIPTDDKNALSGNPRLVNLSLQRYISEFGSPAFVGIDEGIDRTISWQKYICNKQ